MQGTAGAPNYVSSLVLPHNSPAMMLPHRVRWVGCTQQFIARHVCTCTCAPRVRTNIVHLPRSTRHFITYHDYRKCTVAQPSSAVISAYHLLGRHVHHTATRTRQRSTPHKTLPVLGAFALCPTADV